MDTRIIVAIVVVVLLAFIWWYTRPTPYNPTEQVKKEFNDFLNAQILVGNLAFGPGIFAGYPYEVGYTWNNTIGGLTVYKDGVWTPVVSQQAAYDMLKLN